MSSELVERDRHAAAVTAWMERTRALAASSAPAEGPLLPNGTGWVVALGDPSRRLAPRLSRWIDRWGVFVVSTGAASSGVLMPDTAIGVIATLVAPATALLGARRLLAWRRLRTWRRPAGPSLPLADLPDGTTVRVTGVIAPQPTVPTLFRGAPAVLFRSHLTGADETRGIDFDLDLDDGQRARVKVRGALLLDRPRLTRVPSACGPVYTERMTGHELPRLQPAHPDGRSWWPRFVSLFRRESSVGPGDRVEVCGVLGHEADGEISLDRRRAIWSVIGSGRSVPVIVRSVRQKRSSRPTPPPK